jgi:hypothetical protein
MGEATGVTGLGYVYSSLPVHRQQGPFVYISFGGVSFACSYYP